jgi:hypothetical protein
LIDVSVRQRSQTKTIPIIVDKSRVPHIWMQSIVKSALRATMARRRAWWWRSMTHLPAGQGPSPTENTPTALVLSATCTKYSAVYTVGPSSAPSTRKSTSAGVAGKPGASTGVLAVTGVTLTALPLRARRRTNAVEAAASTTTTSARSNGEGASSQGRQHK